MPRLTPMREKWVEEVESLIDSQLNKRELLMRDIRDIDKQVEKLRKELHFLKTGSEELPPEVKSLTTKTLKDRTREGIECYEYEPFKVKDLAELLDADPTKVATACKQLVSDGIIRLVQKGGPGKSAIYKQLRPPVGSKR